MNTYQLLDMGNGRRLEQWGSYRLVRPDPTACGEPTDASAWQSADAVYEGEKGKGTWMKRKEIPENWPVQFDDITLLARLTPYKHTGVFPEQSENWRWMRAAANGRSLKILNLFAYTGGATVALTKDGHHVTHVDSSRPAIGWAKENAETNAISGDRIRWMLEDAPLFATRELKRGKRYDGIVLDPPVFGHSPSGSTWKVDQDLPPLLETCCVLLSDDPVFLVLNGYAHEDTPEYFEQLLFGILEKKNCTQTYKIESSELFLTTKDGRKFSTGTVAKCLFTARPQR